MELENNNKKNKTIILIIGITVLIIILFIFGILFYNEQKNNVNEENQTHEIYVYTNGAGDYCEVKTQDCGEIAISLKVESDDAKIITTEYSWEETEFGTRTLTYVIYSDNDKINLYNVKTKETMHTTLEATYDYYFLKLSDAGDKIIGIIYGNEIEDTSGNETEGFYNISTKEKMYEAIYDTLIFYMAGVPEHEDFLIATIEDTDTRYLLSVEKEEILFEGKGYFEVYGKKDDYFYLQIKQNQDYEDEEILIYNNNRQKIATVRSEENYYFYNDEMYIVENNLVKKYNSKGELLGTSKTYDNIIQVIRNYIVYKIKDTIILTDFDNSFEKEMFNLENEKHSYNPYLSDYYYATGDEDLILEEPKKEGLYLIINDKTSESDIGIEIYFDPVTKTIVEY